MGRDIETGEEENILKNSSKLTSPADNSLESLDWSDWRKKRGFCLRSRPVETILMIVFVTIALAAWVLVHSIAGDAGLWYVPLIFDCVVPALLLPIPLVFSCKKDIWQHSITFVLLIIWIPCVCIPIAVNEGRLHRADYLSVFDPPNRIEANCWRYPTPQVSPHDWANTLNFIHWSDPDWVLNVTAMQYTSIADDDSAGVYYTYCVAPIVLNNSAVVSQCSGYNAYAMCYEQTSTARPCSDAALKECGWQFPAGIAVSRVARGNSIYGAAAEPQFADAAGRLRFEFGSNYTSIGVWWLDDDTDYWAFEGDELYWWRETLWIIAGASWGGVNLLVWFITGISCMTFLK